MAGKTVLVIGASGDVGQGVVAGAQAGGWNVVAAARDESRLAPLFAGDDGVAVRGGDLATLAGADTLWAAASPAFGGIDAVVVSVNVPARPAPLAEWDAEALAGFLSANLITHQIAARAFLPRLPADGLFLGIGGGTADFIIPKLAPNSMAQAALRMFYKGLARENREGAAVRELMVVSMVAGASNRTSAAPEWVTDADIGKHVAAILADPAAFPGPILQLKSREQAGLAEAAA